MVGKAKFRRPSSTPRRAARTCPDFWTLSSLIVRLGPPAPSIFCDLRERVRKAAAGVSKARCPSECPALRDRPATAPLISWGSPSGAPQLQSQGGRSGVPSIGSSIERQVHALVRYDAVRVDEARLDVLRLEPGIASSIVSGRSPAASIPRTCSTASRWPRTVGFPPRILEFTVIR